MFQHMTTENKQDSEPIGFTVEGILGMAGGKSAVAKACGLTIQAVAKWKRHIPTQHFRTEAIMAGLPIEIVRPDMVRAKRYE
mgnify:CR=1 FL=1